MDIKNLARKEILNVKPYEPGKPIEEVQREFGLGSVIKLASNENPLGASPKALNAIKKSLTKINRYPDGNGFYLKKKLTEAMGVEINNIVLGNGSDELIAIALKTFVNKGEKVIIADPTFLMYKIASGLEGANMEIVPMKNFKYDLKAMKAKIDANTKMVFIANPDNPTGSYVTKNELDEFLSGLPENVLVFYDAAYCEFGAEFNDYPDVKDYILRKNIIVTKTFSKAYGLSGLRVGYAICESNIAALMERVRDPFNVNSLALIGAEAALSDDAFLKKTLKITKEGKKFIYDNLKKLNLNFIQSATNFILIDVKADSKEIFKKLLKRGVIVRDMSSWNMNSFIRVTVGTKSENKQFIDALKKVL